uniref:VP5 n=1 Tax=Grass carp reovirus TaxID=128987 RepID=A0A5J6Y2Y2_GCRV|nr:VP5 [Grass carp reovirus]
MLLILPTYDGAHDDDFLSTYNIEFTSKIHSDPNVQVLAMPWLITQLTRLLDINDIATLTRCLDEITPRHPGVFVLLPKWRSFARVCLTNSHLNIWKIPRSVLTATANGERTEKKISDYIDGLVTSSSDVLTGVKRVQNGAVCYTTTLMVLGAPIRKWCQDDAYSGAYARADIKALHRPNWPVPPKVTTRILITNLPLGISENAIMLDRAYWPPDVTHGTLLLERYDAFVSTARICDLIAVAMLLGVEKRLPRKVDESYRSALRMLRLPFRDHAQSVTSGTATGTITCDIRVRLTCKNPNSPKVAARTVTILSVLTSLLSIYNVDIDVDYPLRQETGEMVEWILIVIMLSSGLRTSGGQAVCWDAAFTISTPFDTITVMHRSPDKYKISPSYLSDTAHVYTIAMAKGSFKSTILKALSSWFEDKRIFDSAAAFDSDDAGNTVSPTFEELLLTEWRKLGTVLCDEAAMALVTGTEGCATSLADLYDAFVTTYASTVTPVIRDTIGPLLRRGISWFFVHCDTEVQNANISTHTFRCHIPMVTQSNILIRTGRCGGVTFQVILDYCYRCLAAGADEMWFGDAVRPLLDPWLRASSLVGYGWLAVGIGVPGTSLAKAGWGVSTDIIYRATYCYIYAPVTRFDAIQFMAERRFRGRMNLGPLAATDRRDVSKYEVGFSWLPQLRRDSFGPDVLMSISSISYIDLPVGCTVGEELSMSRPLTTWPEVPLPHGD